MLLNCVIAYASLAAPLSSPVAKTVEIAPGVMMPTVNLGTCCGSSPDVGVPAWLAAGGTGIDTAYDYKDQVNISKHIAGKRKGLFILTKIPTAGPSPWFSELCGGKDPAAAAVKYVQQDLQQLGIKQADIVLLHHSCTSVGPRATKDPLKSNGLLWAGLEKALAMGLTRAIGVSNYNVTCLESLKKTMKIKPAINQCYYGVSGFRGRTGSDTATLAYCQKNKITYESYDAMKGCPFNNSVIMKAAAAHKVSAAQVCLRWTAQQPGVVMAVGTGSDASKVEQYTKEDLGIYGFTLSPAEMSAISAIAGGAAPPKKCNWINDTDFSGGAYKPQGKGKGMTKEQCCAFCQKDPKCDFAVLAGPKMSVPGSCWLKSLGAKPFHRPGDVTCCPEGMKCEKKGKR